MGVISGAGGAVNGVECVRRWKVVSQAIPAEGICSSSDRAMLRVAGNDDWRGFYTAYGHTPDVLPGETFRFIGSSRDGKGVDSQALGAIVDRVIIKWDTQKGKLIGYQCDFSSAAETLLYGNYSATDSSTPDPPTPVSLGMGLDGVAIDEVRRFLLMLSCKNPSYVTSSTAGHTYRVAGNYDAAFQCEVYLENPGSLPTKGSYKEVTFDVGGGSTWDMHWGLITQSSPELPIEGVGEEGLFAATIAGMFAPFKDSSKGYIRSPAAVDWWP